MDKKVVESDVTFHEVSRAWCWRITCISYTNFLIPGHLSKFDRAAVLTPVTSRGSCGWYWHRNPQNIGIYRNTWPLILSRWFWRKFPVKFWISNANTHVVRKSVCEYCPWANSLHALICSSPFLLHFLVQVGTRNEVKVQDAWFKDIIGSVWQSHTRHPQGCAHPHLPLKPEIWNRPWTSKTK